MLDENSLASVNGPDKAMKLSHCYFYIKQLKKQVIDIIATFLLELGTPRERNLVQRHSGSIFVKLKGLFRETGTYLINLAFILLKNYLWIALILKYMNNLYCYKNVTCIYFSMRVILNHSISYIHDNVVYILDLMNTTLMAMGIEEGNLIHWGKRLLLHRHIIVKFSLLISILISI